MFSINRFEVGHVAKMAEQPANADIKPFIASGGLKSLEDLQSFTLMKDEVPVFCGGFVEYWPGRAYAWACFDTDVKGWEAFFIMRVIKRALKAVPIRRVEMAVAHNSGFYATASRRASILGFKLEVKTAEAYFPNGDAASIYSSVKGK